MTGHTEVLHAGHMLLQQAGLGLKSSHLHPAELCRHLLKLRIKSVHEVRVGSEQNQSPTVLQPPSEPLDLINSAGS